MSFIAYQIKKLVAQRIKVKTTSRSDLFYFKSYGFEILGVHALRSYLKLICEYEFHSLPNKKVSGAKDHDKNYIKARPPLVCHLLRNRLSYFYGLNFT